MKHFILLLSFCISISCNNESLSATAKDQGETNNVKNQDEKLPVLIHIRLLIYKNPSEVIKILGVPSRKISKVKDCGLLSSPCSLELQFKNGDIVVQFSNNKAVYFEFNNLQTYRFGGPMYEILGLEKSEPQYLNGNDVCWYSNYSYIRNVAFIESKIRKGYLDYIIVTVIK